ncbi:MAG: hypothetical protein WCA21_09995, partial [Terracidiphilus sp.]
MRKEDAARSTTRAAGSRLRGLVNQLRVAIQAAHLFLFSHEPRPVSSAFWFSSSLFQSKNEPEGGEGLAKRESPFFFAIQVMLARVSDGLPIERA